MMDWREGMGGFIGMASGGEDDDDGDNALLGARCVVDRGGQGRFVCCLFRGWLVGKGTRAAVFFAVHCMVGL